MPTKKFKLDVTRKLYRARRARLGRIIPHHFYDLVEAYLDRIEEQLDRIIAAKKGKRAKAKV